MVDPPEPKAHPLVETATEVVGTHPTGISYCNTIGD